MDRFRYVSVRSVNVLRMHMVQITHYDAPEPPNPFGDPRPDDLPISAAAWDAAKGTSGDPRFAMKALFDALKKIEAELVSSPRSR